MKTSSMVMVCIAFLANGCASILSDGQMNMTVSSEPENATCELSNKEGRYVVKTPGTIPIDTTCSPMTVVCKKAGYKTIQRELDYSHKGETWGNIIAGGGIGYLVDRSTGAACEYPQSLTITLDKEDTKKTNR